MGGVLVLVGSLCYAELATTYPRMGGDYIYLTRAFGRPCGFLFGWAQLAVILTGSIGAMAYAFGDLWPELASWFMLGVLLAGIITALLPPGELPLFRMALDAAEKWSRIEPPQTDTLQAMASDLDPIFPLSA